MSVDVIVFFSILNTAVALRLLKLSNLFVFSNDRCSFLDFQLCFFELPPEHFLQLEETKQDGKNIKWSINEEHEMTGHNTIT